ncbi:hypothetical protein [Collinsella tanakaei]|uniref:hypothetical protein n=1 Tax=Collinsella tanakaei TaxID=626935 RepID=UPI001F18046E|nr:hypothetical protein [Collinsella tanakaei]MCF2621777.1 hypothetical protein [Collinsella tanakaei]
MPAFGLVQHGPALAIGCLVGVFAFVPLLLAIVPMLRRMCDASMVKGMLGVGASFVILFVGVVVVHLLSPGALVAFVAGELVGFFVCWIGVAIAVIAKTD